MKTSILLVRHGQTRSNVEKVYMGRSDEDLDETGYSQARRLAARLARHPITAVYTSPVKRAFTTASIVAEPHHLQLEVLEEVTEADLGEWQGFSMEQVRERWHQVWRQSRIDPSGVTFPGGESFAQVGERAVRAFRQVLSDNQGGTAVVVTHDIVVRLVVAHVLGVPNSVYRRFEIDNASLTVVRTVQQHTRLIALNDTAHLGHWGDIAL